MGAKINHAFTLVELLVVIGIIGVLSGYCCRFCPRRKEKAYRAQCMNDLKQLGVAIQTYADDHGDYLPGPVWLGVYEMYDNEDTTRLAYYLASYMGLPAASATPQQRAVDAVSLGGKALDGAGYGASGDVETRTVKLRSRGCGYEY